MGINIGDNNKFKNVTIAEKISDKNDKKKTFADLIAAIKGTPKNK